MTKTEIQALSQDLTDLYVGLETDLLANIADFLAEDNIDIPTAVWKTQKLAKLGKLNKKNLETIAAYSKIDSPLLKEALDAAALGAINEIEPGFRKLAADGVILDTAVLIEDTMKRAAATFRKQAASRLNLVNTVMGYKSKQVAVKAVNDIADKQKYLDKLNKATGKAVLGIESRQTAMRQCIIEMNDKGIPAFVDKAGREWSPEAYVNMDIRTTVSNTAHQAQFDRMDDYSIDLIAVSSHMGARPRCAPFQGKIFNRKGAAGSTTDLKGNVIQYGAWKDTSYGEAAGLLGINCGHQVYPFIPGVSMQRYFPYAEEENDKAYQLSQQQRELERRIRKSKRECMELEKAGDTEGVSAAKSKLRQQQKAYRDFTRENGLPQKNDRTAVVGYNKTVKPATPQKPLDNGGGSGNINYAKATDIFNDC